jgi:positive regulator of sigma E activity
VPIPNEYVAVRARLEPGRDGHPMLAIEDRRCSGCVACFGGARRPQPLADLLETSQLPVGASLELRWPVGAVTLASVILYGLPLLAMLAGAALCAAVAGPGDVPAVVGALAGLALGGLATGAARRRMASVLGQRLEVRSVADTDAL